MEIELVLRWLHVIGATVLLGTGAGIAFFMVMAHRTGRAELIAHTARTVVVADMLFTAMAVIAQPLTGYLLARQIGWSFDAFWLQASLGLYGLTGMFWLPVVWLQWRMMTLAEEASRSNGPLPPLYYRFYRIWFAFGFPAFAAVLAIIWLMLARPDW